jgi:hypothetical protein
MSTVQDSGHVLLQKDTETTQSAQRSGDRSFPSPLLGGSPLFFKQSEGSFFAIQEWEGYVSCVTDEFLRADLADLVTGETRPSMTVEIPLEEIPEDDIRKIRIGSVFRWSIGYYRTRAGQKDRVSRIVFRQLPRWSLEELADARSEADDLAAFFAKGE